MSELVQRVESVIARHALLKDGDAALVGVSGGVDSMVLLHVLHTLATAHGWKLVVAHLHHGLRGPAADRDQQFVAQHAKRLGLRFESDRVDVRKFAASRNISVEMAGRQLRHEFLARTARSLGIDRVVLAHHADDQVELFFVRLFRGAGTQGLGGMEWNTPSTADWEISLIRPFLLEPKSALEEYAKENRIRFREDTTNRESDILRNRIRNELLPLLRRDYQPQIDRAILRSMGLVQAEGDFVSAQAVEWSRRAKKNRFESMHVALQRRIMQMELLRFGIVPQFEHVEMLRQEPSRWVTVRTGLVVRRKKSGELEARPAQANFSGEETQWRLESRVKLGVFDGLEISWRTRPGAALPERRSEGLEHFDAEQVGDKAVLRHWRPGDRFQPIGMRRPVKLQDLFVNQKIPRECRHKLVLATTTSGEIFWVEGLRIGENFKVTPATERVLEWRWRPGETLVAAPEGEC